MRKHTDVKIRCPFDPNHTMPSVRLSWHLLRCPAHQTRKQLGLPIFHCKYNYHHIFLSETEYAKHLSVGCADQPARPAKLDETPDDY